MKFIFRFGLLPLILLAVTASSPVAVAQTQPDVADVLKKVSETYANPRQYQLALTTTVKELRKSGETAVVTLSSIIAVQKPNKLRSEVTRAVGVTSPTTPIDLEGLIVMDGESVWIYLPKLKRYTKSRPNTTHIDSKGNKSDTRTGQTLPVIENVENTYFSRFRTLVKASDRATIVREERVSANGTTVNCYVVVIAPECSKAQGSSCEVYTWWVDKSDYIVLREDSDQKGIGQGQSLSSRSLSE